jgi:TRAP-type transport system periplasmic protein
LKRADIPKDIVSMRIARRTFLASSIGTVAAPAIIRLARADTPPITLKLHHSFSSVSSVHDKFLAPWARKIEAESGGRIRIDLFPSMQLGGAPAALFDQVRDGSADIVWTAPSLTPGRFPKIETFELPFLASRRALVSSRALTDFAAVHLQDEFRDVYTICFSCSDRAAIHGSSPVRTIEDIKNLRLHVQTRFAADAMRALGARPLIMPSAQLPMGITEHVVDACLDPWHLVPPLRLNDLLRFHTEFSDVSPSVRTYVLAMNKTSYDRLPRDLKTIIGNNSGQPAAAMAGAMWDTQAAAVANSVVERGDLIVTLLPEAVTRWRKAVEPVIDAWRKEVKEQKIEGAKLLLAAYVLLARYAIEPEPAASQGPSPEPQRPVQPAQSTQSGATPRPDKPTLDKPALDKPSPSATPPNAPSASSAPPSPPPNTTSSASVAKPAAPQPPSQHVATPAPVNPQSPPAPPPASSASAAPIKPVSAPTATPMAGSTPGPTPALTTPGTAAPAPSSPTAIARTPATLPATTPAPPPGIAAAPAASLPPVSKPVPKTLDIRL